METLSLFGSEFWSALISMAVFALGAGMIARKFQMNQLLMRRIFGIVGVVLMVCNYFYFDVGQWNSVIETAIEFTVCTYLFAVVAEKRFVPFLETWDGPPKKAPVTRKKTDDNGTEF